MSDQDAPGIDSSTESGAAPAGQSVRLIVAWLIVVLALGYGIYQTVTRTLPLFGG